MKTVKIIHPQFGLLLEDSYQDAVQFKLFLNLVHSCLELNQDLTTFNGRDFLLHIPYTLLRESIVIGNVKEVTLAEYAIQKSKMEV